MTLFLMDSGNKCYTLSWTLLPVFCLRFSAYCNKHTFLKQTYIFVYLPTFILLMEKEQKNFYFFKEQFFIYNKVYSKYSIILFFYNLKKILKIYEQITSFCLYLSSNNLKKLLKVPCNTKFSKNNRQYFPQTLDEVS